MSDAEVESTLPWTGERLVPEFLGDTALEHLHRYVVARELVAGRSVLDIACGEGYGSKILAAVASDVTGVDISDEAVEHARRRYGADIRFEVGSCSAIPLADASVDVVVSFETLEHHTEHDQMMREVCRVLRPGGLLIISTPDKLYYTLLTKFANPYHARELSRGEFSALLAANFAHVTLYEQAILGGSIIASTDAAASGLLRHYVGDFTRLAHQDGLIAPPYLIAVASDEPIDALPPASLFCGWDIPNELEKQLKEARDVFAITRHQLEMKQAAYEVLEAEVTALKAAASAADEELRRCRDELAAATHERDVLRIEAERVTAPETAGDEREASADDVDAAPPAA